MPDGGPGHPSSPAAPGLAGLGFTDKREGRDEYSPAPTGTQRAPALLAWDSARYTVPLGPYGPDHRPGAGCSLEAGPAAPTALSSLACILFMVTRNIPGPALSITPRTPGDRKTEDRRHRTTGRASTGAWALDRAADT